MSDNERKIRLVRQPFESLRLCRDIPNPSPSQVMELLKMEPGAIEKGTTIVDGDIFIPSVGEIDVVGANGGRLILANVFAELTALHLGQAAGIYHWAHENWSVLEHVYRAKGLSGKFSPRIWYLCSGVQPQAQLLLPFLENLPIEIYRYRSLESPEGRWLAMERIIEKPIAIKTMAAEVKTQPTRVPARVSFELTQEEIRDFFKEDRLPNPADDDIQYGGPYFNS